MAKAGARSSDPPRNPWLVRGAVATVLLVTVGLAIGSMRMDSATEDEPAHIFAGYAKVTRGHFGFFEEQPPLINSLSALPLAFRSCPLPAGWDVPDVNPWRVGKTFLYGTGQDADEMIFLARLPSVVMLIALLLLIYVWAYDLSGSRSAAMTSFVLGAFCPNLIASGRLATVDIGATLFCTLGAFTFLRFLRSPTRGRAVAAGTTLGLAVLTKVSAAILLPWAGLALVVFLLVERERREPLAVLARRLVIVPVAALVVFEVVYLLELRRFAPLAPFSEYAKSAEAVLRWVAQPYNKPQYLMGSFTYTGWRTYYPIAMLLKTPTTTLVLVVAAFLGALFPYVRRIVGRAAGTKPWPFEVGAILCFVLLFMVIACASTLDIGLRYVLPVYPFLYVLVAPVAVRALGEARRRRRAVAATLAVLACGSAAAGVAAYPGYLGYFNEFVSRRDADRYLIDSNLDWGQDLKRLARWVESNDIPAIGVLYFGGGSVPYTLGSKATLLPSCAPTGTGYFAISRHTYRLGSFYAGDPKRDCELNFRGARQVTIVGDSILVLEVR